MTALPNYSKPVIKVEGLKLAYGDHLVLQNLTFEVQQGSCLVIMGSSGCWKSTFHGTKPSAVVAQHRTVGCGNSNEDCRDAFAGVRRFVAVAFT